MVSIKMRLQTNDTEKFHSIFTTHTILPLYMLDKPLVSFTFGQKIARIADFRIGIIFVIPQNVGEFRSIWLWGQIIVATAKSKFRYSFILFQIGCITSTKERHSQQQSLCTEKANTEFWERNFTLENVRIKLLAAIEFSQTEIQLRRSVDFVSSFIAFLLSDWMCL